ncbi:expressed unknown protein [Ectocarpus siliculosus]|uniref:Uncharacterized protein n=1 Tax=Ectocarpus siliculosus TaxID=2880 RepID=D7G246_ECTSI|nr:expressed unknown protein [Ectocarpus siliculosus]|eukprot:CBJ33349.1 expressed unknown protein [Ectocarpus siliculosus]
MVEDEGRERVLVVADDVREAEVLQELKTEGADMVLRRAADLDESAVLPDAGYELMRRCEFVVLDIAFVGRWGVVRGRRKEKAWQMALDRILEAQAGGEGVGPLSWRASVLRAGLEELAVDNPLNKELYLALAVLPMGLTFPSEVAAALLYDDALSGEDLEDLEVAEEVAATLERWSILIRMGGGNYRVHDEHSDFIRGCLSTNKDTQDRVLRRWRRYISSVRALLACEPEDLVKIWDSLASDQDDVIDPRPYDRALEAMDMPSAELPRALHLAGFFYMVREDGEGACSTFSKLLKLQETTVTSDGLIVWETLRSLHLSAYMSGRWEEAEVTQRRADAILKEMGKEPVNFVDFWLESLLENPFLSCFFPCATDDAVGDSVDGRKSRSFVDDSASERVFIPKASRNKYVVVGLVGATVRVSKRLDSPVLRTLPKGTVVEVAQIRSRRAHIVKPIDGWASLSTVSSYRILEPPITQSTKYKVIYPEGIFVRRMVSLESRIARIAPFGTVLKATGRTEIYDAVERIEVEDGWVSMRLRNDTGAPLLSPLD